MTDWFPRAPLAVLAFVAVAASATAVRAQGTDAEREACTPDALRLCQDTIPDIPKTTACMKAHYAQLSPRCKVAFNGATGGAPEESSRREAAAPPPAADEGADASPGLNFGGLLPSTGSYEAQIRGYCRQGLIDPFTCRNTLAALHSMQ